MVCRVCPKTNNKGVAEEYRTYRPPYVKNKLKMTFRKFDVTYSLMIFLTYVIIMLICTVIIMLIIFE